MNCPHCERDMSSETVKAANRHMRECKHVKSITVNAEAYGALKAIYDIRGENIDWDYVKDIIDRKEAIK